LPLDNQEHESHQVAGSSCSVASLAPHRIDRCGLDVTRLVPELSREIGAHRHFGHGVSLRLSTTTLWQCGRDVRARGSACGVVEWKIEQRAPSICVGQLEFRHQGQRHMRSHLRGSVDPARARRSDSGASWSRWVGREHRRTPYCAARMRGGPCDKAGSPTRAERRRIEDPAPATRPRRRCRGVSDMHDVVVPGHDQ